MANYETVAVARLSSVYAPGCGDLGNHSVKCWKNSFEHWPFPDARIVPTSANIVFTDFSCHCPSYLAPSQRNPEYLLHQVNEVAQGMKIIYAYSQSQLRDYLPSIVTYNQAGALQHYIHAQKLFSKVLYVTFKTFLSENMLQCFTKWKLIQYSY